MDPQNWSQGFCILYQLNKFPPSPPGGPSPDRARQEVKLLKFLSFLWDMELVAAGQRCPFVPRWQSCPTPPCQHPQRPKQAVLGAGRWALLPQTSYAAPRDPNPRGTNVLSGLLCSTRNPEVFSSLVKNPGVHPSREPEPGSPHCQPLL